MLAVVEHQQQPPSRNRGRDQLQEWLARVLSHTQRRGDHAWHELRVVGWCELDDDRRIRGFRLADAQGQARFASTPRTGQRDQRPLREELANPSQLPLATDKRAQLAPTHHLLRFADDSTLPGRGTGAPPLTL